MRVLELSVDVTGFHALRETRCTGTPDREAGIQGCKLRPGKGTGRQAGNHCLPGAP